MTVFFLAVGLEIKRELLVGELSSVRKAAFAFYRGMRRYAGSVVIYSLLVVSGTPETRGMAIPMATDIAFSLECSACWVSVCVEPEGIFDGIRCSGRYWRDIGYRTVL